MRSSKKESKAKVRREACIIAEMEKEKKEVIDELKQKRKEEKRDANVITGSVSWGLSTDDVFATIDRFVSRGQVDPTTGSLLKVILSNNIKSITISEQLDMNYSPDTEKKVEDRIKKELIKGLIKKIKVVFRVN